MVLGLNELRCVGRLASYKLHMFLYPLSSEGMGGASSVLRECAAEASCSHAHSQTPHVLCCLDVPLPHSFLGATSRMGERTLL